MIKKPLALFTVGILSFLLVCVIFASPKQYTSKEHALIAAKEMSDQFKNGNRPIYLVNLGNNKYEVTRQTNNADKIELILINGRQYQ